MDRAIAEGYGPRQSSTPVAAPLGALDDAWSRSSLVVPRRTDHDEVVAGTGEYPHDEVVRIGIVGSGFVARGIAPLLARRPGLALAAVLTRRPDRALVARSLGVDVAQVVSEPEALIECSDLVIECSGDAVHATGVVAPVLEAALPVVTMDAELHVTTGSWLAARGLLTEAEGDQPGSLAALAEDAVAMGFTPRVYGNVKGFLDPNPSRESMEHWSAVQGISVPQVTSFTDGTKVQAEQVLVANGLDATIACAGLLGPVCDTLEEGAQQLAEAAAAHGALLSDYVLPRSAPPGVFIVATHEEEQQPYLRYYKLGDGPFYVLVRPFHLCHLELLKTVDRVLRGDGPLLTNGTWPTTSLAAVAKRPLAAGEVLPFGIGSFDVRGTAVRIADEPDHVPIGLLRGARVRESVEPGTILDFSTVEVPDSLACTAWKETVVGVLV